MTETEDSLKTALDKILGNYLRYREFPETMDPESKEPWPPEIEKVIAEAKNKHRPHVLLWY